MFTYWHCSSSNQLSVILSQYPQCFTMAMPFNMILTLYVIPCKLSCDFIKLTILYIHVHIFYHFYDKQVSNDFMAINIYIHLYL